MDVFFGLLKALKSTVPMADFDALAIGHRQVY
jgi:hypothetical protein